MSKLVLISFLFCSLAACAADQPTALCDRFRSFQTVQDVHTQLEKMGVRRHWTEEIKDSPKNNRRPPYTFVYLSGPFKISGVHGILKLTFYNGRLMEAQFSPPDGNQFLNGMS